MHWVGNCALWLFLLISIVGFSVIWETGKQHFRPAVSSCHVDYDHVPIYNLKLYQSKLYTLYYFWHVSEEELHNMNSNNDHNHEIQSDLLPPTAPEPQFDGIPILFIPGHAGQFVQGKGFASTMYFRSHELSPFASSPFDIFSVDFSAELSVFHGSTLKRQAKFVTEMIEEILTKYEYLPRALRPTSVLLVGHSMGGVVARLSVMNLAKRIQSINSPTLNLVDSVAVDKVHTVVTIGTPHIKSPWPMDESISKLYQELNSFQMEQRDTLLRHIVMVSISGGISDSQVPAELSELPIELIPKERSVFTTSSSIPSVRIPIAHLKLVRCKFLMDILSASFYDLIDARNPLQLPMDAALRAQIFRNRLLDPLPVYLEVGSSTNLNTNLFPSMSTTHLARITANCTEEINTKLLLLGPSTDEYRCWKINPQRKTYFQLLTSFQWLPDGALQLIQLQEKDQETQTPVAFPKFVSFNLQLQAIISEHLNGSLALIKPNELQKFDFIIFHERLLEWKGTRKDFIILHHSGQSEVQSVSLPFQGEALGAISHFRFPQLLNKHQKLHAMAKYSDSSKDIHMLFPPFFYQVTETNNLIESKFSGWRDVSRARGMVSHSLEFHQSSPLLSAPHLVLFSDIRFDTKVQFSLETNFVQMFRSYFIFIMPVMLGLPLFYLYIQILYWIHKGEYLSYFDVVTSLSLFFLIPLWIFVVLLHYMFSDTPENLLLDNQTVDVVSMNEFLRDEDIVLHTSIPLSSSFLFVALICALGWFTAWSLPPFIVVNILRKCMVWLPMSTVSKTTESVRICVFFSVVALFGCWAQPVVCLAFYTFLVFVNIITQRKDEAQMSHLHYQESVFVLMFLVSAWKFACLFTGIFQYYEGFHVFDKEWIIIYPLILLGVFSSCFMLPRKLSRASNLFLVARVVWPTSVIFALFFCFHHMYRAMYSISIFCLFLDFLHIVDVFLIIQSSNEKAMKRL